MIHLRRGLDLPLAGAPEQRITTAPVVRHVALLGDDTVGLRPALAVDVGDRVRTGQLLFTDKANPGVRFTAPGCGEVVAVNRGARRRLESVVIRLEGDEDETFDSGADARDLLVASGLWTALRARPFGRIPPPDATPHAIFATAIDTRPLAPDPIAVLTGSERDFEAGLSALTSIAPVRLCVRTGATIPGRGFEGVTVHEFEGPHPAGLPGTHIHFVDPVREGRSVWHIGYPDIAAIGALQRTGRLPVERVVALAGPLIERPALLRARLGAGVADLIAGRVAEGSARVLSGCVLAGRTAEGPTGFLGRYHHQITVLADAAVGPRYSRLPLLFPRAWRRGTRALTTAAHGPRRALVPIDVYEKVWPLDILPMPLFKALAVEDIARSVERGCLELDEEDLALASFVCPSKSDFGSDLRRVLTALEMES